MGKVYFYLGEVSVMENRAEQVKGVRYGEWDCTVSFIGRRWGL